MSKSKQLVELLEKVAWEGGWGEMVSYGNPPNIEKFPHLQEAWDNFKQAHKELERMAVAEQKLHNVHLEQFEC